MPLEESSSTETRKFHPLGRNTSTLTGEIDLSLRIERFRERSKNWTVALHRGQGGRRRKTRSEKKPPLKYNSSEDTNFLPEKEFSNMDLTGVPTDRFPLYKKKFSVFGNDYTSISFSNHLNIRVARSCLVEAHYTTECRVP